MFEIDDLVRTADKRKCSLKVTGQVEALKFFQLLKVLMILFLVIG